MAKRIGYCLLLAVCCCGCAQEEPNRYVPATPDAQSALNDALVSWQKSQPATALSKRKPAVQFADAQRKKDQKLRRFEIVDELPYEGARQFNVRLELDNPHQTAKAQYVVFGIDPLWVMRQEDFDMMSRWECPMPHGTKAALPGDNPKTQPTNVAKTPNEKADTPKAKPTDTSTSGDSSDDSTNAHVHAH